MARTQRSGEVFAAISAAGLIRDLTGGGNTTLTGAHPAGTTPLTVGAIANFSNGDLMRIGLESEYELARINGAPAGSSITPRYPTHFDHAAADPAVEVEKVKLGEVTDEGVDFGGMEGDFNAVMAATRRMVYSYLGGHVAPTISFRILNLNLENLAASLGMNETTRIQTQSTNSRLVLDPARFGEIAPNIGFYFDGVRKDGKNVSVTLWGVEIDWAQAAKFVLARGESMPVPFTVRPTSALEVELT